MPIMFIALAAGLPVLFALIFRVHAVMVFLAIAIGSLLEKSVGDSAELALAMVIRNNMVEPIAHVSLLVLPLLITLFFLRKTAKKSQLLLQLLPLIASSLMLMVLVLALLPVELLRQVQGQAIGMVAHQSTDVVISIASTLNLLLAWQSFHHKKAEKHAKHH